MYIGTLEKIESTHQNLRTDTVDGSFDMPIIGKCFLLIGKGLAFGNRFVTTSVVVSLEKISDSEFVFTTQNSTYKIHIKNVVENNP
jgi:hypothetical protein